MPISLGHSTKRGHLTSAFPCLSGARAEEKKFTSSFNGIDYPPISIVPRWSPFTLFSSPCFSGEEKNRRSCRSTTVPESMQPIDVTSIFETRFKSTIMIMHLEKEDIGILEKRRVLDRCKLEREKGKDGKKNLEEVRRRGENSPRT